MERIPEVKLYKPLTKKNGKTYPCEDLVDTVLAKWATRPRIDRDGQRSRRQEDRGREAGGIRRGRQGDGRCGLGSGG